MRVKIKNANAALVKARVLYDSGKREEAIGMVLRLCKLHKRAKQIKVVFANMVCEANPGIPVTPGLIKELTNCLDGHVCDAARLLPVAGTVFKEDKELTYGINVLFAGSEANSRHVLQGGLLQPLLGNSLLQSLLRNVLLTNRTLDLAMTRLRQLLLFYVSHDDGSFDLDKVFGRRFCASLAAQCLLNEYAYFCSDDEKNKVDELRAEAEAGLAEGGLIDRRMEAMLLVLAMYQPLYELDVMRDRWDMRANNWPESLVPSIRAVNAHFQEERIKDEIEVLGTIDDEVSVEVRGHYEVNPYPRWVSFQVGSQTSIAQWIATRHPHFDPPDFLRQPVRLLVAGCGTGRDPLSAAAAWDTRHILAIDLSKSSLAYAIRKSEEMGFSDRIEFRQADILRLRNLPVPYREFDVVSSCGVLHHLEDPVKGWRILLDLLRPGGIMRVALYSELARRYVVKARRHIAENGLVASPDVIRGFRHEIFSSRHGDLGMLCSNLDMYSLSTCRDLLFHTQETRYNLAELKDILDELELEFIGFQGIEHAKLKFRRMFPNDASMTDFGDWAAFEAKYPDTFMGMYTIIARKRMSL